MGDDSETADINEQHEPEAALVEKIKPTKKGHEKTKPCKDRAETVKVLNAMTSTSLRPATSNVFGEGPMLVSDIPQSCRNTEKDAPGGIILGIDEAGRGPVLGPMTYGCAFWSPSVPDSSLPKGLNDSKQLTEQDRDRLLLDILDSHDVGFVLRVLHASEISRNMLRPNPYNLNAMSHDAAMQMIQAVLDAGVKIDTCYIDTVGTADYYRSRLERVFRGKGIHFVVEKKADSKYAVCSAASIVAKVARDRMIGAWKFSEQSYDGNHDFGSGYPSDPRCKSWMGNNLADPVFCFPDLVRFSWGPAKNAVEDGGVKVEWEADVNKEEQETKRQAQQMSAFLAGGPSKKQKPRTGFFEKQRMTRVEKLIQI